MGEIQAWVGLFGIGLLIVERITGGFGWIFGRTKAEDNLRERVENLRKDVDRITDRGSERNGELQRVIGHMEIAIVEVRKDCEALRRDFDALKHRI